MEFSVSQAKNLCTLCPWIQLSCPSLSIPWTLILATAIFSSQLLEICGKLWIWPTPIWVMMLNCMNWNAKCMIPNSQIGKHDCDCLLQLLESTLTRDGPLSRLQLEIWKRQNPTFLLFWMQNLIKPGDEFLEKTLYLLWEKSMLLLGERTADWLSW